MNYRVYIKRAKPNILPKLVLGALDGDNGSASEASISQFSITKEYIPVDDKHVYEFVSYDTPEIEYWICEYDSNKVYLNGHSISKKGRGTEYKLETFYSIENPNTAYVRLQIKTTKLNSNMFLRSSDPVLIHDSNTPEKDRHLLSPNLVIGDSISGSLEFVMHPGNHYYKNKINLWTDTFYVTRVYKDGSEKIIWDGRAISEEYECSGNRLYHCEGALSYLNDVRVIQSYQDHKFTGTVYTFIDEMILSRQNSNSVFYNRFDRSFFYIKENGLPQEGASTLIDYGTKYAWFTNYESGLKWINDIKDTFNAHFKIRYRPYDSVTDDIICRCFTALETFETEKEIPNINDLISNSVTKYQGDLFYRLKNESVHVYVVNKDVLTFESNVSVSQLLRDGSIKSYSGSDIKIYDNRAVQLINANRFPVLKAEFGKNIFDAKRVSDFCDFASVIIPKGIECSNSEGNPTNIFMTTQSAYVDGDFNADGKPGKRVFNAYYLSDKMEDYSLIKNYGYVQAVVDFDGAETPKALKTLGYKWFKDIKKSVIKQNIEVNLTDLNSSIECKSQDPYADPEYIDVWTKVIVTIPSMGITEDDPEIYYVSELSIPLDNYLNTQVTLVNRANLISETANSSENLKGSAKGIMDTSTT